jgi:hypothetical protein
MSKMKSALKMALLACGACGALVFGACQVEAAEKSAAAETLWMGLEPAGASVLNGEGVKEAQLPLDFSKNVLELEGNPSEAALAKLFTFKYQGGGKLDLTPFHVEKSDGVPAYTLTVVGVPAVETSAILVTINKTGIVPDTRKWQAAAVYSIALEEGTYVPGEIEDRSIGDGVYSTAKTPVDGDSYKEYRESAYWFPSVDTGYTGRPLGYVTIKNTGNRPTGTLTVSVSAFENEPTVSLDPKLSLPPDPFTVSLNTLSNIEVGGVLEDAFAVGYRVGLADGIYSATITVSGDNGISESFDVGFTIEPQLR